MLINSRSSSLNSSGRVRNEVDVHVGSTPPSERAVPKTTFCNLGRPTRAATTDDSSGLPWLGAPSPSPAARHRTGWRIRAGTGRYEYDLPIWRYDIIWCTSIRPQKLQCRRSSHPTPLTHALLRVAYYFSSHANIRSMWNITTDLQT